MAHESIQACAWYVKQRNQGKGVVQKSKGNCEKRLEAREILRIRLIIRIT